MQIWYKILSFCISVIQNFFKNLELIVNQNKWNSKFKKEMQSKNFPTQKLFLNEFSSLCSVLVTMFV